MKKILYVMAAGAMLLTTSCQSYLDEVQPTGSTLSLEQLKHGAEVSEDRAGAGLPGMYALLNEYNTVYAIQGDFGYPSFVCRLEHAGDNVVSTTHGYNWFNRELRLTEFQSKTSTTPGWAWIAFYRDIKLANDVVAPLKGTQDPVNQKILGQALAQRAFCYLHLAQLFQKTYKGNEDAPCVPIVTEETKAADAANNPRASVRDVYKLILDDLNKAIEYLNGFQPEQKNAISEATAYGLRARAHMLMHEFTKAAEDAQKAIEVSGATPYSIEDCSIPNFDDVQTSKNALWGIIITKEDRVTKSGIANWTSMFTSLCFGNGGYTTLVGTYKMINSRLFDLIPDTDVRKGWWAYEEFKYKDNKGVEKTGYTSPIMKKAYPNEYQWVATKHTLPLTMLKFAPTDKDLAKEENSVDFMLMRVEEMYYIMAEAKAMAGDLAGGKQVLENFVKTYRDPGFTSKAADAKALQDEIYLQKRVEFFGEGISWFDMIRMGKGIDRVDVAGKNDGGYPPLTRFNVPAGDPIFVLQIPKSEEQANKAIVNNPLAAEPKDML